MAEEKKDPQLRARHSEEAMTWTLSPPGDAKEFVISPSDKPPTRGKPQEKNMSRLDVGNLAEKRTQERAKAKKRLQNGLENLRDLVDSNELKNNTLADKINNIHEELEEFYTWFMANEFLANTGTGTASSKSSPRTSFIGIGYQAIDQATAERRDTLVQKAVNSEDIEEQKMATWLAQEFFGSPSTLVRSNVDGSFVVKVPLESKRKRRLSERSSNLLNLLGLGSITKGQQNPNAEKSIEHNIQPYLTKNVAWKARLEQDGWNYDIFEFSKMQDNNYPLTVMGMHLLDTLGVIHSLRLDRDILLRFLMEIENGYHHNPFHNALHGCDVGAAMYYWLKAQCIKNNFSEVAKFAAIMSALAHDVEHPGTNNTFQIVFQTELATKYNDVSVLENHHLATFWKWLRSEKYRKLLDGLDEKQLTFFRNATVNGILATDMNRHTKNLTDLKQRLTDQPQLSQRTDWDEDTCYLVLSLGLHCADVSNPTKGTIPQVVQWAKVIFEEFFIQGDLERKAGKAISPNCDRGSTNLATCQVGFIDYIIRPLFSAWAKLCPKEGSIPLANLARNREYWVGEKQKGKKKKAGS